MTAPPQQQILSNDHHYFEWSTSPNPLQSSRMVLNRRSPIHITSTSNGHLSKKQKIDSSSLNTYNEQNHLSNTLLRRTTQKIGSGMSNSITNDTDLTPHLTLNTLINVSVNGQTGKSLGIHPSSSSGSLPSLLPYSDWNLSLYLKDLDLMTFDTFLLPVCPHSQDYLTVDGLLTFLMSNKRPYSSRSITQHSQYPSPQYPMFPQSMPRY